MTSALRDVADVHLVSQIRNRDALVRAGLVEGKDFTAIDSEAVAKPLWKLGSVLRMGQGKGWTTVQAIESISYRYFEHLVWRQFQDQLRAGDFRIVHRLTPLTPTIPSSLAARCRKIGVPFVLGPLNGGVPWPKQFDAARRQEREWLSRVRGAYKLLPNRRSTMMANAIIVGSRHTQSEIPQSAQERTVYMPENGIDPARFSISADHKPGILRACFVGRMVPVKGTDMALEASIPLLKAGLMTLDFVGNGQMVDALKEEVRKQGIGDAVTFHGWVDHAAVQQILSRSTLFLFPSVKDFGGGAALEAMALGVPPLVLDYAGPGELVDESTGFKIPMGRRDDIVTAMTALLSSLAERPDLLKTKGMRAKQRVEDLFVWKKKASQMLQVYQFAQGNIAKPDLFPA
jgi:glycosyltransferase involved in cell wall biosynthesis